MYKYQITLTDGTLLVAESQFSQIYTIERELKEEGLFIKIGNVIVRKGHIQSVVEVKVDE